MIAATMSSSGSVTDLICQVKTGDAAATRDLCARYFRRLLGLARALLLGRYLGVADEEDVVNSALAGFFRGAERGQYTRLHNRRDLWHLLAKITRYKALKLVKEQCRWPGKADVPLEQIVDSELPPDLEVLAKETIEHLLYRLGKAQLRSIAVWKWEGYSNEEIASRLGCCTRTIERKLQLIRTIWNEEGRAMRGRRSGATTTSRKAGGSQ
jgi:DNA-directed RNA polymerase specialized sigma24 family protein